MYTSILYENQKTLTLFEINAAGNVNLKEKLILNGTPLVRGVDYTVFWPINTIAVISSLLPNLRSSDDLDVEVYTTDELTLLDSLSNIPINFNYNYLEVYGDVANGVYPMDTTDKSVAMNTPLVIRGCQDVNINAHLLHIVNIGAHTDSLSGPIKINNVAVTGSQFNKSTHSSLLPLTFDANGVLTTAASNKLIEFASIPFTAPLSLEMTVTRNDGLGIDAFLLDNIGFRRLESATPVWVDITGTDNALTGVTIGDTFKVDLTSTHIKLYHNATELVSYSRNVTYTTDKGTITPSGALPYLTSADFTPTTLGLGEIKATFGAVSARQVINVIITRQPIFAGGYAINVPCPSNSFNLATLTDTNLPTGAGIALEFHTSATVSPATKRSSDIVTGLGVHTIYAVQRDTVTNCYGPVRSFTVTINDCGREDPTVSNFGGTSCNSHVINPVITNNYPNPQYTIQRQTPTGWETEATALPFTATQSGTYRLRIFSNDGGIISTYEVSHAVVINPDIAITTDLPSGNTSPNSLTFAVNHPSLTTVTWQRSELDNSGVLTWVDIPSSNSYTYTPTQKGVYRARAASSCNTVYTSAVYYYNMPHDDGYVTPMDTPIYVPFALNDERCEPITDAGRTFFKLQNASLLPVGSGIISDFDEDAGTLVFTPTTGFTGLVTFKYDMYCTLHPTNNVNEAFSKKEAIVSINVLCNAVTDFQIEFDPIAYYGGKTCYERYSIVNIFPVDAEINDVIVVTDGVEITQPYSSETRSIIGKIVQKKSVKVKFIIDTCDGTIEREIVQKVSLKPCCD